MFRKSHKQSGFTIVELLIVIIVIAVLATIIITAYNGVQTKARDAKRLNDIQAIAKAINVYTVNNGTPLYADYSGDDLPSGFDGGWEASNLESPGEFLKPLKSYGLSSGVAVDPTNNDTYFYRYYPYAAGSYGCDSAKGVFWILIVNSFENMSASQIHSPGFSCPGRDWSSEGAYVTGGFVD